MSIQKKTDVTGTEEIWRNYDAETRNQTQKYTTSTVI